MNLENLARETDPKIFFESIFKLYYEKILSFSENYVGNREDAEEITQDIFLKLWGRIEKVRQARNVNAYLFGMTKNACLDHIKHQKVVSKFTERKKLEIQTHYLSDETTSRILEDELQKRITEGIDSLPEKCRAIFVKSRFEGLKNQEIADLYSISKNTVDNHIAKGLSHLRLYLKEFTSLF